MIQTRESGRNREKSEITVLLYESELKVIVAPTISIKRCGLIVFFYPSLYSLYRREIDKERSFRWLIEMTTHF